MERMQAYIDGWLAGYDDALAASRHEGWTEFKVRLQRMRKARKTEAPAAA